MVKGDTLRGVGGFQSIAQVAIPASASGFRKITATASLKGGQEKRPRPADPDLGKLQSPQDHKEEIAEQVKDTDGETWVWG